MFQLSIAEPQSFDGLLSLKGKTAIITGGSRGIGEQVVTRFTEAGANVVFTGRGKDALKRVEEKITAAGGKAAGVQADVSNLADSQRVVDFTVEKFGGVDILVNNAAVFPASSALDMTEAIWDETFDTDAKGAFFMAKFAAVAMIQAGKGGRIINFLSTAAIRPASPLIAYGAAKSALWYATQAMAQEFAPHRILVNAVTPGATMTAERVSAMSEGKMVAQTVGENGSKTLEQLESRLGDDLPGLMSKMMPLGRTGYPDDLAKAVLFLASDMAQYISGVNITVDGGQSLQNPMSSAMDSAAEKEEADENADGNATLNQSLAGKWKATLNTPMGVQDVIFDYHVNDNVLTGSVTLMGNKADVENGRATADGFTHQYKMKGPVGKINVKVTGKLEGDKILGAIKIPVGSIPFEGTRV